MKSFFSILIAVYLATAIQAQDSPIVVESAPEKLSDISEGWQNSISTFLNSTKFYWFAKDPNYQTSEFSYSYGKYKDGLVKLLNQEALLPVFYDWVIPSVKAKWEQMDYTTKGKLKIAIEHCDNYLSNFSMEEEDKYLEECNRVEGRVLYGDSHVQFHRDLKGSSYFIRWDRKHDFYDNDINKPHPESVTSPYRRLETFLYRKAKDGVKIKHLRYFTTRLLKDLVLPEGTVETMSADNVLQEKLSFKDGKLEGIAMTYKYGMIADTGKYVNNQKVGTWKYYSYDYSVPSQLDGLTIEKYENGRIVERIWKSYFRGKLSQTIWFDVKKQEYRFTKTDINTAKETIQYEGAFFEK